MSQKDWIEKDYYKVLGVAKDAKPDDVKKAFKKLAQKYHPDRNPGDAAAEERFKEVSEANDILSEPAKRKEYDELRAAFGSGGFRYPGAGTGGTGPAGTGGTFDLGDLFGHAGGGAGGLGDLFGGLFRGRGGAGRAGTAGPRRGQDVDTATTLSFAEAAHGATVKLQLRLPQDCPACHGSRARPGTRPRVCPACTGTGHTTTNVGGFGLAEPCRECQGTGFLVDDPCPTCAGAGRVVDERVLTARIPPGVKDGQRIRLPAKGAPGAAGGVPGDLNVTVTVQPHPVFGRDGDNLTVRVPVTFPEAALGAEITVPTLEGRPVTLRLPEGTATGRTFRVRGHGVPHRDGTKGDLLVTVEVQVPQRLSGKAREAVSALAAEMPHGVRDALLQRAEASR